jgi:Protein of unknown function (DUF1997)
MTRRVMTRQTPVACGDYIHRNHLFALVYLFFLCLLMESVTVAAYHSSRLPGAAPASSRQYQNTFLLKDFQTQLHHQLISPSLFSSSSSSSLHSPLFLSIFPRRRDSQPATVESASATAVKAEKRELMSFGNKIELSIRLPTKDLELAAEFLKDPNSIISSTWEQSKLQRLDEDKYLLKFRDFPLPGIDTISPEIEVTLKNVDGVIRMVSGNWTLRGQSSGIMKDSRFLTSFDIKLNGEITMVSPSALAGSGHHTGTTQSGIDNHAVSNKPTEPIMAVGWVEYRVKGNKPRIFRMAPSFILDGTIGLIQQSAQEYATAEFANRFSRAFRDFMVQRLSGKR